MGLEKAEIKQGTLRAQLEELRKQHEALLKDLDKIDGAAIAYKGGARTISSLTVMIDKELEAGGLKVPESPELFAVEIKRWIQRASGVMVSLADKTTANGLMAQGRVQGIAQAIQTTQKMLDAEMGKAEGLAGVTLEGEPEEAPESGQNGRPRPVGARPGSSIAAQRKAEEQAAKGSNGSSSKPAAKRAARKAAKAAAEDAQPRTRRRKKKAAEKAPPADG